MAAIFVHHSVVERAIFAVRRRIGDQLLELVLAEVVEVVEGADFGLVGRDLGLGEPGAGRVALEIVARLDRQVARRQVHAPFAEHGVRRSDRRCRCLGVGRNGPARRRCRENECGPTHARKIAKAPNQHEIFPADAMRWVGPWPTPRAASTTHRQASRHHRRKLGYAGNFADIDHIDQIRVDRARSLTLD
jgi:hypothetical protein